MNAKKWAFSLAGARDNRKLEITSGRPPRLFTGAATYRGSTLRHVFMFLSAQDEMVPGYRS